MNANAAPKKAKVRKPWSKKKIILVSVLCVIIALILWIAGSVIYQIVVNGEYYEYKYSHSVFDTEGHFEYSVPNFSENIFEDPAYLSKNRDICYIYGAQSSEVSLDEDGSVYGREFVFFQKYFRSIVYGDRKTYVSFFTDDYSKDKYNLPLPKDDFTMQKVYNISVDYREQETVQVSDLVSKRYFIVKYCLLENNGTFRPDLEPDTTVALLFEIIDNNGNYTISKILKYID